MKNNENKEEMPTPKKSLKELERENRRKIDGSVQAMQEFAKWYEKDN